MRRLIPFALLLATLCGAPLATPTASAADAAPKIAVLRLEEVLRQSKVYAAGMETWKKQQAEAQTAIAAIDEQLKRLDGQLQVLKPDAENYGKYQEELETLKLKKKMSYERARGELERRQVALVKDAYKQMRSALANFSQERGIMLVHLAPDPELGAPSFNEVQLELGLKSVLYYDPSLDITDSFIQYLNSDAKAATPAPAPAPAATPAGAATQVKSTSP